ncbi:enoyl-ACP reductase FabV [Endozoicomonas euniceicola]|uniref:trans-2-enoyl-CoA reductase (NAD(+)) n=1 Tax=Endozoicomonas euniceicola TaxID=1234143 RepID=A0ABY6GX28_9GAMM|nr:enoyl-ACP reductase FabV [Endozoicomonas euniceicola]UYM17117.1 trans-2-enoyl-CoA reductase family protein [Endozoicomonas euniceicola]
MDIRPIIKGVIAKNCNPEGCRKSIQSQIHQLQQLPAISTGPKKVLVIGASSGLGLATRISLAFGGRADTIGISYERPPSGEKSGTAGWFNNLAFTEAAEKEGLIAKNFVGDAYSEPMQQQVVDYIRSEFEGSIDCIVYSLAAGVRPRPDGSGFWKSSLKPVGEPFAGNIINIEKDQIQPVSMPPASPEEVQETVKVMGGENWEEWIRCLDSNNLLARGVKTIAFSYIGSDVTYPIYFGGTMGQAKLHLHDTSDRLNKFLSKHQGEAHIGVSTALVSKASVFIPGFSCYMMALSRVLKQKGEYETSVAHMHRMMKDFLFHPEGVKTDENRLIRADDRELNPEVQAEIFRLIDKVTAENFRSDQYADYSGFIEEFMGLSGFTAKDRVFPETIASQEPALN